MSLRARIVNALRKHPRLYDSVVGFSRALGKREPLNERLAQWAKGRGVVLLSRLPCGFPDTRDGSPTDADNPRSDHRAEHGKDFLAEGRCERS